MPERAGSRMPALVALALGLALSAVAGFGHWAALAGGLLAQPLLALAMRGLRGGDGFDRARWARDGGGLLLLWALALLCGGLLLAWPLGALLSSGSLASVMMVCVAVFLGLLGLWRTWPVWRATEVEGGDIRDHWNALARQETLSWSGFAVALAVCLALACCLLLAWPGLLSGGSRWAVAGVSLVLYPLLHLLVQRMPAAQPLRVVPVAAATMPVVEMPDVAVPARAEPAHPDGDLEAALYTAARGGRVERALELLEAGADAHALPDPDGGDQRSLAVLAAVLPDLRLLRALIRQGVDLNTPHAGMTPLLAATRDSWHGRPEAVMTLLANGADPRMADHEGNTPLHHAARSSDPGVAALLRDAAAELDACNLEGLTPLGVACSVGNWPLARFLLERGARTQVEDAVPVLLAAASGDEDDTAGLHLLLKHKAKVDARDRHGRSALHVAAGNGHLDMLAALLTAGADVDARDGQGLTPLMEAAHHGGVAVFDALLAARADWRATTVDGRNALVLAVQSAQPSPEIVRRLVELGADPSVRLPCGRRIVDLAAEAGRWTIVSLLDPDFPLPASVMPEHGGHPPVDRAPLDLLREGLALRRFDQLRGLPELLSPAELGRLLLGEGGHADLERIDWLLAHGADAETLDNDGATALFALLARGPDELPAIQRLLAHGASPAGKGGLARFLDACVRGERAGRGLEQCALDLLERGADPFAPSPDGDPALSLAIRLGWERLLERLVACGVDLDVRDARGMTALHLAAALGRETLLKVLVRHGANPEVRAEDGQTPLGVALASGRRDLADWLDWRGWRLPRRALEQSDVPAAAIAGDVDALGRLLELGFAVDAIDAQGCTALLRASGGGHLAAVDVLLARGADPHHVAASGATPLSAAVSMCHGDVVERLLAAGASLEQRLPGEVTVLMLAAALGHPELCARLVKAGGSVHASDAQGLTPLHCAALYGFTARDRTRLLALFDTLILAGSDVNAIAAGGVTPLLLLLGARAEPGTACDEEVVAAALDQLLDEDAIIDAQDPRGFGPLHLAALHGLLHLTKRLLRAGADPDLRDGLNRTPREIAVMRGFIDVAAEFMPVQPGVPMSRFLRESRH